MENVFEDMYKIDYFDEKNKMFERVARGECQNVLIQTNENTSFGVQTVKM